MPIECKNFKAFEMHKHRLADKKRRIEKSEEMPFYGFLCSGSLQSITNKR
jgi:hypothetical protein